MSFKKYLAVTVAAASVLVTAAPASAQAQDWPNRPIKFTIGFPPGGLNDVLARLYGTEVGKQIDQPIVMDYRPGASGRIAMGQMARTKGDGYTLAVGNTGALMIAPHLYSDLDYDPVKDLTPVFNMGLAPLVVVVRNESPVKSLPALLEEAKTRQVSYGTLGVGSPGHLAFEDLSSKDKFQLVAIPYKGSGEQIPAALSGQIDVATDLLPALLPLLRDNKLRALAVTSEKRLPQLPDTPTLIELGYEGMVINSWHVALVPSTTPKALVDRLAKEYQKASQTPAIREHAESVGLIQSSDSPEELAAALKSESQRWGDLIKSRNIKLN